MPSGFSRIPRLVLAPAIALALASGGSLVPAPASAQGRYQPQGAAQRHFADGEAALQAADSAHAAGDEAGAKARHAEAADAFEKALEADPAYIDAYAKFGLTTYSLGQSDRAIARLQPALARNPESPELQFWLGNHLLRAGKAEQGLPHLERVARSDGFPEANLVLGTHYYKVNDLPKATAALEKYLAVRPDDMAARGTLGNAYFKSEKYPEALREFEEVRRASPDNIQVQINLGTCHYQLGNYAKAVELLTDALRKEPKRESVIFNLAQAYFQWKKYDQSVPYYRQFIALKPDSFNGYYFLGSALLEMGPAQDPEALKALNEAARLKPDVAIAHYKIGLIHLRKGALDDAERALSTARAKAPTDPWAISALGTVSRQRGNLDAAATLHQQAADAGADKARLHANLALTRLARKQLPEAEAAASRAAALEPADPFVKRAVAHVAAAAAKARLSQNDARGAEARLREALALNPDLPALRADLALALAAGGRTAEALVEADAAATAAGNDPGVQAARARVLLAAGRLPEARAAAESAGPAAASVAGAAALRAGDPDAALRHLQAASKTDPSVARNQAMAHLYRAARAAKEGKEPGAGTDDLRAALQTPEALDAALAPRVNYLGLVLALRRIDSTAALGWLGKLGAQKEPVAWLPGAPPGHLDYLAAYAQVLAKREDKAIDLLEGSRALRNKGGAEARVLRRAYERQAEKAYQSGNAGETGKLLKAAAALGRDPVVDHNLAVLELRGNRKAKVEARLKAASGQVAEAWYNLAVVYEAVGRHEEAFRAFLRYAQLGGPYAAKARDVAEAKRRIFGFNP